ncbi:DUF4132 domain-containing protein [Actinoplanes derwentensis]|uniref:DUF4132 domain-containing protein n=1 Tax=Actinoplanes derwentensis TaxID=113562 RepID=A0A1H1ZX34_9ACTN|nr:DUF4132 domain-containing protein [Actinoplanes derwentensis]GID83519.1 hypothetical protein Ade03nite_24430 [Actinoplanes derwentensis]SDT37806.1 protein of unknown function [Actinoplanes derwentensis]
MGKLVLPDEDAWALPTDWQEIMPRRGGFAVPPPETPEDSAAELREALRYIESNGYLPDDRAVLHDPDLAAAGDRFVRPWLDTEEPGPADPRGAAVAVLTVAILEASIVEPAVAHFGTGFGVRMVAAMGEFVTTGSLWEVDPSNPETYEQGWRAIDLGRLRDAAQFVRARLATAPDAEYDDARTVLAAGRTTPIGRILASFLIPTETGWVDEDCAAAAEWAADDSGGEEMSEGDHRHLSVLLLFAASTITHLEQLRDHVVADLSPYSQHGNVGTVLDGVGPEAGALLATPFYAKLLRLVDSPWWPGVRPLNPDGLRLLSVIPTDEAFRALCRECFEGTSVRSGSFLKSGVLTRYPVRAVRVLTELDAEGRFPIYADLLAAHLVTDRRLPVEAKARAEQIVAGGGAGLGTAWATLLDDQEESRYRNVFAGTDDEKRAITALAAIPFEGALGLIIDRVDRKHFRSTFLAAARKRPEIALRALRARTGTGIADELLRDHLLAFPELAGAAPRPKTRSLPNWLVVAALPAVGRFAPETVCELVAASTVGEPHPDLAEVRAHHSAAALAWTVFEQWRAAEYPTRTNFAMLALGVLGDDSTVAALTAFFPEWAKKANARMRNAIQALGGIGTDVALRELLRLSRKAPNAGLQLCASENLVMVATARGVTVQQLLDRLVPEPDLTPLDYGPRRFTITLDDQVQTVLHDERGNRLSRVPRTAATDDPELAEAARARYTELRKDLKTIITERRYALELAMVTQRRWTAAEFTELFVEHPLTWHLTRRLLWATFAADGSAVTAFRPAEDRTFADIDDKTWTLDPAATVGLPHPWHLGNDRAEWSTIFADYAIIQPFPQVGRELFEVADADFSAFTGRSVPSGKLFSLTARGWSFDDGHQGLLRDGPDGPGVEIDFGPGYHWQEPDAPQTLERIRPADLAGLPPLVVSEVLRDLHFLIS